MSARLDALTARLAEKLIARAESDAAVNALSGLITAAANGEAEVESGARLSMADAVKGADAIRQVHTLLCAEVDALEARIRQEKHLIAYAQSPLGRRWGANRS